jgi:hypothetical protein
VRAVVERRVRNMTVAAAVVTFGGVIGLGDTGAALGPHSQPNACELFTRREAAKILGKPARRETNITGTEASQCSYTAEKDVTRLVGLGVGEFASDDTASNVYARARADARFDGLKVESVRRLGNRAYYLPETNNFERTVRDEKVVFGELTVLEGSRVYTVYLGPPSKTKARDAINSVIAD